MPTPNKHERIALESSRYRELEENYIGLCRNCGEERENCEPDAEDYECESCGQRAVDGMTTWLFSGRLFLQTTANQSN